MERLKASSSFVKSGDKKQGHMTETAGDLGWDNGK